jgi:hypothetical protein
MKHTSHSVKDISNVWNALPRELQEMVLSHLSREDKLRMSVICKNWRDFFWRAGMFINLSKRRNVDDQLVHTVVEICRDIVGINLSNCYNITEKSLSSIAQFAKPQKFTILNVSNCWKLQGT